MVNERRYASYWNAFLFCWFFFLSKHEERVKMSWNKRIFFTWILKSKSFAKSALGLLAWEKKIKIRIFAETIELTRFYRKPKSATGSDEFHVFPFLLLSRLGLVNETGEKSGAQQHHPTSPHQHRLKHLRACQTTSRKQNSKPSSFSSNDHSLAVQS